MKAVFTCRVAVHDESRPMNRWPANASANRKVALAVFLLSLALGSIALLAFRNFLQDDAYISMRYAANLLSGNGLVWNPGERVEGYTNFLFIMATAFLGRLGMALPQAVRMLGFLSYFILMGVLLRTLWKETPKGAMTVHRAGPSLILLPLGAALTSIPLAAWSLSGMETVPFALLVTVSATVSASFLSRSKISNPSEGVYPGLLLALATLMRPEGALLFAVTFLYFIYLILIRRTWPGADGGNLLIFLGGSYSAVVFPYLGWKYFYYGNLLPNTYYAKIYGLDPVFRLGKGLIYTLAFVFSPPWLALLAGVLAAVGIMTAPARRNLRLRYFGLVAGIWICYVITAGGDFMPHFRFFVPLIPILVLIIREALHILAVHGRWRVIGIASLSAFVGVVLPYFYADWRPLSASAVTAKVIAPYIEEHWPHRSLIAVNAAGALPYMAPGFRYIDMLGMNDSHIARRQVTDPRLSIGHLKGDGSYLLERKPDYVLFAFPYGADVPMPVYPTDRELFVNDQFLRQYRRESIWVDVAPDLFPRIEVVARRHPQVKLRDGRMLFVYHRRL